MRFHYDFGDLAWHWGQAALVGLLLLSGVAMHWPIPGLDFHAAVRLHDLAAVLLLLGFAFGAWVRVVASSVRRRDLLGLGWQLFTGGDPLSQGGRAPQTRTRRVFWSVFLVGLIPVQVVSGLALWLFQVRPGLADHAAFASLHLLGAWLILSAIVAHLYLMTCRSDRFAGLRAMLTGDSAAPPSSTEAP